MKKAPFRANCAQINLYTLIYTHNIQILSVSDPYVLPVESPLKTSNQIFKVKSQFRNNS